MQQRPSAPPAVLRYDRGLPAAGIRADVVKRIAGVSPSLAVTAKAAVDAVANDKWAFEWQLPRMLGAWSGLPRAVVRALTVCSVLGLCAVQLFDQLADDPSPQGDALRLVAGGAFLSQALTETQRVANALVPGHRAVLLAAADQHMAAWLRSVLAGAPVVTRAAMPRRRAALSTPLVDIGLAARGAPLKIIGAAACALSGRFEALSAVDAMVDDVLLALVLLDHYVDWQPDLDAGRANAFVSHVSPGPQDAAHVRVRAAQVMAALLADRDDGSACAAYFGAIQHRLTLAESGAGAIGCAAFAAHARALAREVRRFHLARRAKLGRTLNDASQLLFGAGPTTPRAPGPREHAGATARVARRTPKRTQKAPSE